MNKREALQSVADISSLIADDPDYEEIWLPIMQSLYTYIELSD